MLTTKQAQLLLVAVILVIALMFATGQVKMHDDGNSNVTPTVETFTPQG